MSLIKQIDNALSPTFCEQLIGGYSGFLEPAAVGEGAKKTYKSGRVALSHEMQPNLQISAMTKGFANMLDNGARDLKVAHCDLICYGPGMRFDRHKDAAAKAYTIIYFLNEGFEGGDLRFDSGEVFSEMPVGSAVVWKNTDDSYHEVTEVTSGLRFVLAHWVLAK